MSKIIDTYGVYGGRGEGEGLNHGPSVTGPVHNFFYRSLYLTRWLQLVSMMHKAEVFVAAGSNN